MIDLSTPTEHFSATREFITRLSESWLQIRQSEIDRNRTENHHFNPLRSITIKETDHSRILGELLKPDGSHGQGALFLVSFLKRIGIDPVDEKWTVSVERDNIDILLHCEDPLSIVIIENKSCNAVDQKGQLYRYWFKKIHQRYGDICYNDMDIRKRFRIIYLPPVGYSRPSEKSLLRPDDAIHKNCDHSRLPESILDCRSFQTDVAGWLREIATLNLSTRLKTFIHLYTEIWEL